MYLLGFNLEVNKRAMVDLPAPISPVPKANCRRSAAYCMWAKPRPGSCRRGRISSPQIYPQALDPRQRPTIKLHAARLIHLTSLFPQERIPQLFRGNEPQLARISSKTLTGVFPLWRHGACGCSLLQAKPRRHR